MARLLWTLILASASLVLLGPSRAEAQTVIVAQPRVSYYYAPAYTPPVVSYYSPPAVYTPPARVSYYVAPAPVVTYQAPAVSYYPATAVVSTRYGLFGRPRVSTVYYYP